MSACNYCGRLDFVEIYQEEARQLSWLAEDIAALYGENSNILQKIKKLNEDLEDFEEKSEFYEESSDACEDEEDAAIEGWRTELTSLERDIWLQKEVYLRETLMQQLLSLSQDLSALQPQHRQRLHHHHKQPHLPRHLWGHQTLQWRPPSLALRSRKSKTRSQARLQRWIMRRMPML